MVTSQPSVPVHSYPGPTFHRSLAVLLPPYPYPPTLIRRTISTRNLRSKLLHIDQMIRVYIGWYQWKISEPAKTRKPGYCRRIRESYETELGCIEASTSSTQQTPAPAPAPALSPPRIIHFIVEVCLFHIVPVTQLDLNSNSQASSNMQFH